MIYYNKPFKRITRAFIRAIKVFFSSLVSKSVLITIICMLILMLFINENHVEASSLTTTGNEDIYQEMRDFELKQQEDFILFCYYPFIENTDLWVNTLKPIFDEIKNDHKYIYISTSNPISSTNNISIRYTLNVYRQVLPATYSTGSFKSQVDNRIYDIVYQVCESPYITYLDYNTSDKQSTISTVVRTDWRGNANSNFNVMKPCVGLYSDKWLHFMELVYGGSSSGGSSINYSVILNDIKDYLDSIEDYTELNNYCLNMIMQTLNTIANKSEIDYSNQISDITGQVNNLNSSIQSQTQQQHADAQATQNAINNQTQQQHQDAQATQNTIEESTNAILSTDADDITMDDFGVSSPVIEGSPDLTNIFDLIYNSFMSVYEDNIYRIQFKLPSGDTTYNYDIPADALSSKLPSEFLTLISVFWWVILGGAVIRFIVNIIHQVVTYSNGSVEGSSGGFLSELTMTPTEFVLFNILH